MSSAQNGTLPVDQFAAIVGEANVLRQAHDREPFENEPRGLFHGRSALVLKPADTREVSKILKLASDSGIAIVPQGGNTGLVGGQMPDRSGCQIILSTQRLNKIRQIDTRSNTVTAEAGVILETLQNEVDKAGRLFPLSLASQGSCQIGGNLSSNAGGTGVLVYGNARQLCLGLEVVLPSGDILDDLRMLKKDNTGYDLKEIFIGAEGTLGVITAAVLKIYPKPRGKAAAIVGLGSPEDALALFDHVLDLAGNALTAFELIGRRGLEFALRYVPGSLDPLVSPHPWYALLETSSNRSYEDAANMLEDALTHSLEKGWVRDAAVAGSLSQQQAFWHLREALSPSQRAEGVSIKHDISVPVSLIPDFIEIAGRAVEFISPDARIVCFGHMGDGNLHYNISQPAAEAGEAFAIISPAITARVHEVVRQFNGSISAEHGIGQLKRDELAATAPPVALDLMRRIKKAFDPKGIMNPGKLL